MKLISNGLKRLMNSHRSISHWAWAEEWMRNLLAQRNDLSWEKLEQVRERLTFHVVILQRYVIDVCWLAANPEIGDLVPGSGGCRKVRWSVAGSGKRGGVRVIYFTRLANGEIWLLVIYKKAVKENIPAHILKSIREVLENE